MHDECCSSIALYQHHDATGIYSDFLAAMHLDKPTYNPVLGLIHRVHDGYGDLIDWEYRHTPFFKRFIMDLQELNKRYFFYRDLDKRIALYEAWLDRILETKDEEFLL